MCDGVDEFDVKTLLWDFVSISRPSETITKILRQKEADHNMLIECMKKETTRINTEKDSAIKSKANILKKILADVREDVKMHFTDVRFKIESLCFEEDFLLKSLNTATAHNQKELLAVEEFCKFLLDMEKDRSEQFKSLLKETKLKAVEVAHELPFVLDEIFELEIANLNQITMSNYRHYSELEKHLKLKVKNDLREWTNEIIEMKESIKERWKTMAKKSVAYYGDVLKGDSRSKSLSEELNRFNSLKSVFTYAYFGEDNVPVSTNDVENWLREVQRTLASLGEKMNSLLHLEADQSAKNIVALYKSMITVLFHRFLEELEDIKNSMFKTGLCHKKEIEDFKCDIYTPSVEQLNIEFYSELESLQKSWGNTINDMTDTINSTYIFLKKAASLWDEHFERVQMLQELVLRDIEKRIKNNACLTDTYEANLNIALEKLRQGLTQKQLKSNLSSIYDILNKMQLSYANQCSTEIDVVRKYKNMMDVETEVLMSEIKRFLVMHPPDLDKDPKKQRGRASQISLKEDLQQFLPLEILYCVFQVDAVKNWMFGLWEAINQYLSTGKQEISNLTDEWVKIQIEKIEERFELKLSFHQPRYQHIKCFIYDKRLRELILHEKMLTCHKSFVEHKKKQLKSYKATYENQCNGCCKECEEECQKIIDKMADMNSSYELRGFGQMIKLGLQPFEKNLKKFTDEYLSMCTEFVDELRISNYKYVKSLKLFSEGGNFNAQEIIAVQKHIQKLEDTSIKQVDIFIKAISETEEKCFARLHAADGNIISKLNQYLKEHEHNERLVKKIQKFQRDLREKAQSLKKAFKHFEEKLHDFSNEAGSNLGKVDYLDVFLQTFQTYKNEVLEVTEFIKHPEPIGLYTVTSVEYVKNKPHVDLLLNRKLNFNGNDFISTIVTALYNSFIQLEESAKDFYQSTKHHHKLLDPSRLQPSLDDCMNELLQKYKPYLLQCEICWMENVTAFLTILNKTKLFQENFLISFENAFYRICLEGLNLAVDETWQQLNAKAEQLNNKLKQIHNRLKVMFGHPKNTKLLRDLEEDYKELNEDNQQKFGGVIPPHKEYLEKVYDLLTSELDKVLTTLSTLKEDDRLTYVIKELTTQLDIKSQLLSPLVNKNTGEGVSEVFVNKDTAQYIQNYFKASTTDLMLEVYSLKAMSLDTLSSNKTFEKPEDFLIVLQEKLVTTLSTIETFVDHKMVKANEDFKHTWVEDIKYILNLYKVKYDNKIF